MPVPRSRLAAAIVATALAAGAVIVVLAARAVMADSSDDAAWVAVALGLLCIAWGIGFGRLRDDPSDSGDAGAAGAADVVRPWRVRVQGFLTAGLVMTGAYVGLRAVGRPIDTALVGPIGYLALRLVIRGVDRLVRRRERRGGDGTGGPAIAGE